MRTFWLVLVTSQPCLKVEVRIRLRWGLRLGWGIYCDGQGVGIALRQWGSLQVWQHSCVCVWVLFCWYNHLLSPLTKHWNVFFVFYSCFWGKSESWQWNNHQWEKHVRQQSEALEAHFLHNDSSSLDVFSSPRAEVNMVSAFPLSQSSAGICWPLPWIQLSSNNNPQQQTILITEQRASGCSRGQRPSAAYYSHCSPNDPAGLLRISKLSEQLPARNLQVDFCLPRVGVNGKRKLNFSLKFNCWSCLLLSAFHTTEPFLSVSFCFSSEVWIPRLPRRTSPPPESNTGLGLIFGRHISPREISLPPPWALHLSDEQVKHGRSLSARR